MTDLATELAQLLLNILPLVAAALWLAIGIWPLVRYHYGSPFQRTLTAAAWLLGVYALIDWFFLQTKTEGTAVLLSEVRASMFTAAVILLFMSSKWLFAGHARYDPLVVVPGMMTLVIVWDGMTTGVVSYQPWGPQLARNASLYMLWAGVQLAYIIGSVSLTLALFLARTQMVARLRKRIFWSAASLLAILAAWASTNMYNNLTQTSGVPWFSSLLVVPAAIVIAAFLPLSPEEIGEVYRAVSAVEQRVEALYVFYRTGEPLAAIASSRTFPIEAEQLQGVLEIVGNFVETSMKQYRGYAVTAMHFDRLGIVAVRGQFIIAAAVYEGAAYDAVRSELLRIVRDFETRRWDSLSTWEGASGIAEEVADDLARLLRSPSPAPTEGAAGSGAAAR